VAPFLGQVLQYYILHFAAILKLLNYLADKRIEVFENVALQDLTLFFLDYLMYLSYPNLRA